MQEIRIVLLTVGLCLRFTSGVPAQEHDKFEGWCDSLRNAAPTDLVQFLNAVVPNDENARCVTWAIHRVGEDRYEPAITSLVKLLGFRRPETQNEKIFFSLSQELLPAEVALERIGTKAQPEVLAAIKSESTPPTARENALAVYMELNKDHRPDGIARLKNEQNNSNDAATKQRLAWAVQKALNYCDQPERAACRHAATDDTPR